MLFAAGTVFDYRYTLERLLGRGGMGIVYLARDSELNRNVAIKILEVEAVSGSDCFQRFERECKSLARLHHRNIAEAYRCGVFQDKFAFLVMEYCEGRSLRSLIGDKNLSCADAIDVAIEICAGMQAAHNAGIVHRDLKPDNVIVSNPQNAIKILDFGLSLLPQESQRLTTTGLLIGSSHYMSPEQCIGAQPDHRADIYSLGCVLYEMLAGGPPFDCDNPIGLIHKHTHEDPPSLPSEGLYPKGLDKVISKAMQKSRELRQQTMTELADELDLVRKGQGDLIAFAAIPASSDLDRRRRAIAAASLVIATVLAGSICMLSYHETISSRVSQNGVSLRVTKTKPRALKSQFFCVLALPGDERPMAALRVLEGRMRGGADSSLTPSDISLMCRLIVTAPNIDASKKSACLEFVLNQPDLICNKAFLSEVLRLRGALRSSLRDTSAERDLRKSLRIAAELGNYGILSNCCLDLTQLLLAQGQPSSAVKEAKSALKCFRGDNPEDLIRILRALAAAQIVLGESKAVSENTRRVA